MLSMFFVGTGFVFGYGSQGRGLPARGYKKCTVTAGRETRPLRLVPQNKIRTPKKIKNLLTKPRRSAYNKMYGENYATPSERTEYICRNALMTTQAADAALL